MGTLLGTPYERGKSDVIVSRLVDNKIAEGLIVCDAGDNKVEEMASGKIPLGVMGQNEIVGCSVVVAGLKVYAQADDDCVPTAGAEVYVTNSGKVTHDSNGTTLVNATFADNTMLGNGIVENLKPRTENNKCVAINFVGGF